MAQATRRIPRSPCASASAPRPASNGSNLVGDSNLFRLPGDRLIEMADTLFRHVPPGVEGGLPGQLVGLHPLVERLHKRFDMCPPDVADPVRTAVDAESRGAPKGRPQWWQFTGCVGTLHATSHGSRLPQPRLALAASTNDWPQRGHGTDSNRFRAASSPTYTGSPTLRPTIQPGATAYARLISRNPAANPRTTTSNVRRALPRICRHAATYLASGSVPTWQVYLVGTSAGQVGHWPGFPMRHRGCYAPPQWPARTSKWRSANCAVSLRSRRRTSLPPRGYRSAASRRYSLGIRLPFGNWRYSQARSERIPRHCMVTRRTWSHPARLRGFVLRSATHRRHCRRRICDCWRWGPKPGASVGFLETCWARRLLGCSAHAGFLQLAGEAGVRTRSRRARGPRARRTPAGVHPGAARTLGRACGAG